MSKSPAGRLIISRQKGVNNMKNYKSNTLAEAFAYASQDKFWNNKERIVLKIISEKILVGKNVSKLVGDQRIHWGKTKRKPRFVSSHTEYGFNIGITQE